MDQRPSPNIVLTGFMGTGKTTVGRIVAERLGLDVVDTDTIIEERHGPIPTIFAERGEGAFRDIERELASELAARTGLVISTGGRMMLDEANRAALAETGPICCLVADAEEIHRRVAADTAAMERPLLAGSDLMGRIVELLAERAPRYAEFPQIDTTGRAPDDIASDVIELWARWSPAG